MWAYLVVLAVFWKPMYYLGAWFYVSLVKKQDNDYISRVIPWFNQLWSLVKP